MWLYQYPNHETRDKKGFRVSISRLQLYDCTKRVLNPEWSKKC